VKLTELFAELLERETHRCRAALEQVPEGRNDWKPHDRSMQLGYLATLVATMPSWVAMTVDQDELDLDPPGGSTYRPPEWTSRADLLKALDESAELGRRALAGTTDEHLHTPWKLLVGGRVVMEAPRHEVLADTFGHLAHHRGQLTVYLRLNEAKVPSIYGPSADEPAFG
jgi:hypothetical protein